MKKILVLSQDKELCNALKRAFRFVLEYESDGKDTIENLNVYDVIFCCCLNNFSFCEILKSLAKEINKFTPILFLKVCFREYVNILIKATDKIDIFKPDFSIGEIECIIKKIEGDFEEDCKNYGNFSLWRDNLELICQAYDSHYLR